MADEPNPLANREICDPRSSLRWEPFRCHVPKGDRHLAGSWVWVASGAFGSEPVPFCHRLLFPPQAAEPAIHVDRGV